MLGALRDLLTPFPVEFDSSGTATAAMNHITTATVTGRLLLDVTTQQYTRYNMPYHLRYIEVSCIFILSLY